VNLAAMGGLVSTGNNKVIFSSVVNQNQDQDPAVSTYPYEFLPNVKLNNSFIQKIHYIAQNMKNYITYDADEKNKTM
jgi:hypothetical protein